MNPGHPFAPEGTHRTDRGGEDPLPRLMAFHGQESKRPDAGASNTNPRILPRRSRRDVLRAASAILGTLSVWLMNRSIRRSESLPENSERLIAVPWNAAPGIHFFTQFLVVNSSPDRVAVFSATCTHLGCQINCAEGSELVCPCHGSRFSLQGDVTHGPAGRPLRALPFQLDRGNGRLLVTLESTQT